MYEDSLSEYVFVCFGTWYSKVYDLVTRRDHLTWYCIPLIFSCLDYHENWNKLEPLYSVISNVCTVQGEGNPEDVYEVAERQLFETLEKVGGKLEIFFVLSNKPCRCKQCLALGRNCTSEKESWFLFVTSLMMLIHTYMHVKTLQEFELQHSNIVYICYPTRTSQPCHSKIVSAEIYISESRTFLLQFF